jgi:hypothetical protein
MADFSRASAPPRNQWPAIPHVCRTQTPREGSLGPRVAGDATPVCGASVVVKEARRILSKQALPTALQQPQRPMLAVLQTLTSLFAELVSPDQAQIATPNDVARSIRMVRCPRAIGRC